MKPDIVVDIGNSRMKWGRCQEGRVTDHVSLPVDDPQAWAGQLESWQPANPIQWMVCGVDPARRAALLDWLTARGERPQLIDSHRQLPVRAAVPAPERVGIDRLLNAVAAGERVPCIVIDAGTAVTVDLVDAAGQFRGGVIFPGIRLMTRALHQYTALLPLVTLSEPPPPLPGTSTETAIQGGVFWAVAGGVQAVVRRLQDSEPSARTVFLTGGDAALLAPVLDRDVIPWPAMTLEGIRIAAEALP